MKRVLVLTAAMVVSGMASAVDVTDPAEAILDRVNSTFTLECRGIMTGSTGNDWVLRKNNMSYFPYGNLSHYLVDAFNTAYAGLGDKGTKALGFPQGLNIPGE